jgi:cell division protein ZapA (FtsZ GTPase activity inhibitor)
VLAALNLAHELQLLRERERPEATSSARSTDCTTASTRSPTCRAEPAPR